MSIKLVFPEFSGVVPDSKFVYHFQIDKDAILNSRLKLSLNRLQKETVRVDRIDVKITRTDEILIPVGTRLILKAGTAFIAESSNTVGMITIPTPICLPDKIEIHDRVNSPSVLSVVITAYVDIKQEEQVESSDNSIVIIFIIGLLAILVIYVSRIKHKLLICVLLIVFLVILFYNTNKQEKSKQCKKGYVNAYTNWADTSFNIKHCVTAAGYLDDKYYAFGTFPIGQPAVDPLMCTSLRNGKNREGYFICLDRLTHYTPADANKTLIPDISVDGLTMYDPYKVYETIKPPAYEL